MVIPAILCPVKHFSQKKHKKPESLESLAVYRYHDYLGQILHLTRADMPKLASGLRCHIG